MNLSEQAGGKDFFVRLKLLEGIRIIREVKSAFALYFWYVARTTVEYEFHRSRIGAVLGGTLKTDQWVADDLSRHGTGCSVEQVRRWRTTLTKGGYIAGLRTPVGHRIIVFGSAKFPNQGSAVPRPWVIKLCNRRKSTVARSRAVSRVL